MQGLVARPLPQALGAEYTGAAQGWNIYKSTRRSGRAEGKDFGGLIMHEQLKIAVGIDVANCNTCAQLGSECDGGEPEYSISWPVCRKFPRYEFLKPFPFKTEQKCWQPDFWHSKFTKLIDGSDESLDSAFDAFKLAKDTK